MCQLSIVVESKGLDSSILILFELHLVLYDLDTCLEDTLVLPGLSDLDLPCPRARAVTRMGTGDMAALFTI